MEPSSAGRADGHGACWEGRSARRKIRPTAAKKKSEYDGIRRENDSWGKEPDVRSVLEEDF
jgi:hypothetical protein